MKKERIGFDRVKKTIDDFVAGYPAILSQADFIIGVSRGGLVPAALLAAKIDKPLVAAYIDKKDGIFFDRQDWVKGKNILVVDDVIRSGKTLWLLKNHLEKVTRPGLISFFALYRALSLENVSYKIPSFALEIDRDVVFPWDN